MKGHIIRAEQVSDDMYVSIDLVVEVIERQVDEDVEDDDDIKIVRTKKFEVKPMYPEDACIQMDLLGHNFYVFRNAESDEVNVVYKRKGGTYGIIEPEY